MIVPAPNTGLKHGVFAMKHGGIAGEVWDALGVSRESLLRLESLANLIAHWQRRINLISPSSLSEVWTRHILDSCQLLPLIPKHTWAIADLGSGGGFPSLVLAACQSAHVHFYESSGKKAAFLEEALRQMRVSGTVHRARLIEGAAPNAMPHVQVVTARAFAPLTELLSFAAPFLAQGGIGLFHKGQDVDAELTQAAKYWTITAVKHLSLTDSQSVILEVREITHIGANTG